MKELARIETATRFLDKTAEQEGIRVKLDSDGRPFSLFYDKTLLQAAEVRGR